MAKKKTAKKKTTQRGRAKAKSGPAAGPDLSQIAEDLRPLAVEIDRLTLDPRNARTHDEHNITAIAESLRRFGQVKPLVGNRRNGQVVAGNGTLLAAKQLGWTHLAVVWGEYTDAQQTQFSIADNRTAELAGWNETLLLEQIDLIEAETPDLAGALLLAELRGAEEEKIEPLADPPAADDDDADDAATAVKFTFFCERDRDAVLHAVELVKTQQSFEGVGVDGQAIAQICSLFIQQQIA